MDFRRIPFQFSSTDPAKRQAELQKRFGLPVNSTKEKMHIDFENPGLMGFIPKSSASSSPRLQHRVPVFVEGDPEPMNSSVDSRGSPVSVRKPHVRVIPIEIEGDDTSTKRHRNLSGPANNIADRPCQNASTWLPEEFAPYVRPPVIDPKLPAVPRERSIPIQVEGVQNKKAKTVPVQTPKPVHLKKETVPKPSCNIPKVEKPVSKPKVSLSGPALSLKKIEGVLEKLKTYHSDVEKFTGTVKEKRYRYLDEMLTRLMLELDDVDTMGNEEVRLSRKAAVKRVQASVDLLETKVIRETSAEMSVKDNSVDVHDDKIEESQNVEMDASTTQEDNVVTDKDSTIPALPNENLSKLPAESTSETEQHSEVESYVSDGQEIEVKDPEETNEAADGNIQIMEVDENIECETITESIDSPIEKSKCISESNGIPNMPIELVSDGETCDIKETEQEPVVSLADGPMKEIETDNEINNVDVDEDIYKLGVKTQVPSSACAKKTTAISSEDASCEDVSKLELNKLETNKHPEVTVSKHSSEVSEKELLGS